jgi:hypothetical protein
LEDLARSFLFTEEMNCLVFGSLSAFSSGVNFDHTGSKSAASFSTASSMVRGFSFRFLLFVFR